MASTRRASSSREPSADIRPCRSRTFSGPALRIVMLEVLTSRDVAEDHRLRDPELFWTEREVDVPDDQSDEADTPQSVQHIGNAPRRIAEDVRVACHQIRADAPHHHDAG